MKKTFAGRIIASIVHFVIGVKDETEIILVAANKAWNAIKIFAATPTGQAIELVLEGIIPAPFLTEFTTVFLPTLLTDLGLVAAEVGKPNSQIITDGLTKLASLTGNIKVATLNSANALTATWLAQQQGVDLPIQQSLTVVQTVHAPVEGIAA